MSQDHATHVICDNNLGEPQPQTANRYLMTSHRLELTVSLIYGLAYPSVRRQTEPDVANPLQTALQQMSETSPKLLSVRQNDGDPYCAGI